MQALSVQPDSLVFFFLFSFLPVGCGVWGGTSVFEGSYVHVYMCVAYVCVYVWYMCVRKHMSVYVSGACMCICVCRFI